MFGHVRGFQRVHAPRASHRGEEGEDPGPGAHVHHDLVAEVRGVLHHGGEVRARADAVLEHVLLLGEGGVVAEVLSRGVRRDLRVERVRRSAPRGGGDGDDGAVGVGAVGVGAVVVVLRFGFDSPALPPRRFGRAEGVARLAGVGGVREGEHEGALLLDVREGVYGRADGEDERVAREGDGVCVVVDAPVRGDDAPADDDGGGAVGAEAEPRGEAGVVDGRARGRTDEVELARGAKVESNLAERGRVGGHGALARARLGGRVRRRGERREGDVRRGRRRRLVSARPRFLAPHRRGAALARARRAMTRRRHQRVLETRAGERMFPGRDFPLSKYRSAYTIDRRFLIARAARSTGVSFRFRDAAAFSRPPPRESGAHNRARASLALVTRPSVHADPPTFVVPGLAPRS